MGRIAVYSLVCLAAVALSYAQIILPGTTIHPVAHLGKCLEVRGAVFVNGTPVQVYDCNGTNAQRWTFNRNEIRSQIRVSGTNFCLDAGGDPSVPDGTQMKIWECYDNLPRQEWFVGDNGYVRLSSLRHGTFDICLDLTDGRLDNTNVMQTWQCSEDNLNQLWSYAPTPAEPECPTPVCATCPAGQTPTVTIPVGSPCPDCGCIGVPCPTYTCAACLPGATPTFTTPAGGNCPECACIPPTPAPTVTP
ncbi:ricin B lectin domain-containing protein [Coprinopsis sp. MPI-PUGE-AT-0042]|nr:ricin B lectin domain-containing protein [Coprinopsis sp. MPI-PUGE-AT-0042]